MILRTRHLGKSMRIACAVAFLVVFGFCGDARSLDFNDVLLLRQSGVQDGVILNMVRQDEDFSVTPEQAAQLRAAGLSEAVVAAMPVYAIPAPVASSPTVVSSSVSQAPVVTAAGPVEPVLVTETAPLPALYAKEGWLTVANTDWETYFLAVDQGSKRLFLSRNPNGGMQVDSGQSIAINLRKETYKLYGDTGEDLKIKIREQEVTRLSLVPYGVVGNAGLKGVVQDRERVRSEILFANYVPPPTVVVQEVPTVIVQEPPPVIVVPGRPYYYRHRPYRGNSYHFGYRGW